MTDTTTPPTDPNEGPGKGRAFFERAKTVAATNNFDYAIDMYIEGLNREPFNLEEHKALRDTAMRRKVAGGKPAGGFLGPKGPYKGKSSKEALLNAEWILAKDVGHIPSMLTIVRNAALLGLKDVALWIGNIARDANRTNKSPKADIFIELADIFEKLGEYEKASECIRGATALKPDDMALESRAKDLAAQETLKKGKYEEGKDFKESLENKEMTKQLLEEENLNKSEDYRLKMLVQYKADWEANPREVQVIDKYTKALAEMEAESYEDEAIDILTKSFADTKIYRFKVRIGDIKMRRFARALRPIRAACLNNPNDKEKLRQFEVLNKERLAYELEEFRERADNFPTDMEIRFQFGRRLYDTGKFDEAIVALQQAQNSPKRRVESLLLLGRSFMAQKMIPEALDTFKRSIDEYELASTGNKIAKELFYWYAFALEKNSNNAEAIEIYSKIVRWDIGFRDARKRLNDLRGGATA